MADEAGVPGAETGEEAPEKVFTQEQLESLIKDRVTRERKSLRSELSQELRTQLLVDEEFRKQALREWKVEPSKGGNGKPDDDTVKHLFEEWEGQHVKPLVEETQGLKGEVETLRSGVLESDLLSVASGKVQAALLAKRANGKTGLYNLLEADFVWDAEDKTWRVKGKDGGFKPSPSGEHAYMTPEEHVRWWMAQPENKGLVLDTTQSGANFSGTKGTDGKKMYARDEYARLTQDPEYYAKHRDELLLALREGRVR